VQEERKKAEKKVQEKLKEGQKRVEEEVKRHSSRGGASLYLVGDPDEPAADPGLRTIKALGASTTSVRTSNFAVGTARTNGATNRC
jgi:hypothetical protein